MSESLLSTAEAQQVDETVTDAPVDQPNPDQATSELPEWLLPKYMKEGREPSEAIAEQAKAYAEAQKIMGAFTGAPEEYEFRLPEGVEGEIDTELDAYKQFTELAKTANMNNDTAQQLFNIFVGYQNQMAEQFQVDFNHEKEQLGPKADERIANVARWAKANLDDEGMQVLESMTTTAAQIQVLENLIAKTRNSPVPKTSDIQAPVTGFSMSDFNAAVASEKYKQDPAYRKEIREKAKHLFPDS